jgi:hypothetical protein
MKLLLIILEDFLLMSLIDNINITKNICLHHGEEQTNYNPTYEDVENLVLNYIEDATGCTIFNKSNMLLELKTLLDNQPNDLIKELSNIINKNIIPQINFEKLFKSDLEFTFVFNQDEIVILYKNKKVELNSLNDIKKDLLENKSNYLPVITELFIENIGNIIEKLIKKDMSVKYYLINIPIPYWKLFEIKSKHISKKTIFDQNLEDIISGKYYQVKTNSESDDELKAALIQIEEYEKKDNNNLSEQQMKELDSQYRMEVMSYLNDEEMDYFLEKMEYIDDQEKNIDFKNNKGITMYVGQLLNFVNNASNNMIKYYVVFKMFTFLLKCDDFLNQHDNFRNIVYKKANQLLENDLVIFQSTGLELSNELSNILYRMKDFIEKINEKKYGNLVEDASESEDDNNYFSEN